MAKTSKEVLKKFDKLNDAIGKKITKAAEGIGFDIFKKFAGITEYISTGSYITNAVLSGSLFGGVPNTRSVEFAGKSGCLPGDEKIRVYIMKSKSLTDINIKMQIEYEE